jgi:hypothetical protein
MEPDGLRPEINRVTERIINCAYRVGNTLGSGFLEKVYENALAIELRQNGVCCATACGDGYLQWQFWIIESAFICGRCSNP